MKVQVGINGFGRIGRQVLKAILDYHPDELEVVAFNDIGDLPTMAHLLKYDSNYGRFDGAVEVGDNALIVNGKPIKAFKETDPANIPWGDLGIEIVVESTGIFTIKDDARQDRQLFEADAAQLALASEPGAEGQRALRVGSTRAFTLYRSDHFLSPLRRPPPCGAPG